MTSSNFFVPGINIRSPWAELIASGKKLVETRSYPLPPKFQNRVMAIIETGTNSKPSPIIGLVIFENSILYPDFKSWRSDFRRHLVDKNDLNFGYDVTKPKYGWIISASWQFKFRIPGPCVKGIKYAGACEIPDHLVPEKTMQP